MKLMSYNEYAATFRDPTPEKWVEFLKGMIKATFELPPQYFIVAENRFATPEEAVEITNFLTICPTCRHSRDQHKDGMCMDCLGPGMDTLCDWPVPQ